jgi:hypothetical protein
MGKMKSLPQVHPQLSVLQRLRQQDHKFKASLGYIVRQQLMSVIPATGEAEVRRIMV